MKHTSFAQYCKLFAVASAIVTPFFTGCAEQDDSCERFGTFADGLNGLDRCWAPPENYCSGGATQVVTKACDEAYELCCSFGTGCTPCGWRQCTQRPGVDPACDQTPVATDGRCDQYIPNDEPICID